METSKQKDIYAPEHLKIAVIGGGNIGTQFACVCSAKGYAVNVYTSKPQAFGKELEVVNETGNIIRGKIANVTSDMGEAIFGCGVVFITYPAFQLKKIADLMLPHVRVDMSICVVPGTGGAEFSFQECMKAGATICGLQRVPSVARLEEYGRRVRAEGLRDRLFLAAIPGDKTHELSELLTFLFGIPCEQLPNYLSVTLTPSNPILHTTKLCTLFAGYENGMVYERNPLFYGEWSDESSKLLIACDEELQQMCRKLPQMNLTNVRSLKCHYKSNTVEALTKNTKY